MLHVLVNVLGKNFLTLRGAMQALSYRRIFVYNICLITISDTVSDGATKRLILNVERAQDD